MPCSLHAKQGHLSSCPDCVNALKADNPTMYLKVYPEAEAIYHKLRTKLCPWREDGDPVALAMVLSYCLKRCERDFDEPGELEISVADRPANG